MIYLFVVVSLKVCCIIKVWVRFFLRARTQTFLEKDFAL